MMAVCHTVVPEREEDQLIYQASSPGTTILFLVSDWFLKLFLQFDVVINHLIVTLKTGFI